MDINKYLKQARKSIGKFCIEECNAYCCKKGYLILSDKEVKITLSNMKDFLERDDSLKIISPKSYSLKLHNSYGSCPSLKDNKCIIHNKKSRSNTCKDYPIFKIDDKTIHFSKRCLAVKQNKFYPYIHKLKKMGFIVD
jgi:hypothetical protein